MKQKQATIWIRQSLLVLLQTVLINLRIKVHTLAWNYVSNKESNDLRKSLNYTCIQSPLTASVQERGNGEEENRQFISSPLSKPTYLHCKYMQPGTSVTVLWLYMDTPYTPPNSYSALPDYYNSNVSKVAHNCINVNEWHQTYIVKY